MMRLSLGLNLGFVAKELATAGLRSNPPAQATARPSPDNLQQGSPPTMTEVTTAPLRPLADTSPSAIVAGFIAMMTGYTSSLVLMFQAGQAAGLTSGQISSWIWAISIGMAVCSIGLSLRYRTPITIAWSTPGAALLITVFAFNLVGDGLRDVLDPRSRG